MNRRHARPVWQTRLEALAKVVVIAILVGCVFVSMTSVDPEIASRALR